MASAPTSAYNNEKLSRFLDHIGLPKHRHHEPPSPSLLSALHKHTISTFPYENLSLHYNPAHYIDLDPQHLYRKTVVDGRGRGGYCMETAILFNHMLLAMGFDAYTAGVRTRRRIEGTPQGDFPGWGHIVNIVTFPDGSKYHSDVSFGGDGPTLPMPLIENKVHQNLGTQQIRLARDWVPTQFHRTEASKLWIYQYRNSADRKWQSFYAFGELEFFCPDWGVVNHWICTHPTSNQVNNLLVVKFLRRQTEGSDEEDIYGKYMLVNTVMKRNMGGRTEVVKECKTEEDRVKALKTYFDITLLESEKLGIKSSKLELK